MADAYRRLGRAIPAGMAPFYRSFSSPQGNRGAEVSFGAVPVRTAEYALPDFRGDDGLPSAMVARSASMGYRGARASFGIAGPRASLEELLSGYVRGISEIPGVVPYWREPSLKHLGQGPGMQTSPQVAAWDYVWVPTSVQRMFQGRVRDGAARSNLLLSATEAYPQRDGAWFLVSWSVGGPPTWTEAAMRQIRSVESGIQRIPGDRYGKVWVEFDEEDKGNDRIGALAFAAVTALWILKQAPK